MFEKLTDLFRSIKSSLIIKSPVFEGKIRHDIRKDSIRMEWSVCIVQIFIVWAYKSNKRWNDMWNKLGWTVLVNSYQESKNYYSSDKSERRLTHCINMTVVVADRFLLGFYQTGFYKNITCILHVVNNYSWLEYFLALTKKPRLCYSLSDLIDDNHFERTPKICEG